MTPGVCVQATNQQGSNTEEKKLFKEMQMTEYAHKGRWPKRKGGGGGSAGGGESLKGPNNLHDFLYESWREMRMQLEDCQVTRAEQEETFRQRGEQKDGDAEQAAPPDSWQVPYRNH